MFVSCFGRFRLTISELDCEQSLFPSDLVRVVHARATRVVICVSRAFCSTDQEKRETARSLSQNCFQGSPLSSSLAMFILETVRLLRPGGGGGVGFEGVQFCKRLDFGGSILGWPSM